MSGILSGSLVQLNRNFWINQNHDGFSSAMPALNSSLRRDSKEVQASGLLLENWVNPQGAHLATIYFAFVLLFRGISASCLRTTFFTEEVMTSFMDNTLWSLPTLIQFPRKQLMPHGRLKPALDGVGKAQ